MSRPGPVQTALRARAIQEDFGAEIGREKNVARLKMRGSRRRAVKAVKAVICLLFLLHALARACFCDN
jgi:hypothetical protein